MVFAISSDPQLGLTVRKINKITERNNVLLFLNFVSRYYRTSLLILATIQ